MGKKILLIDYESTGGIDSLKETLEHATNKGVQAFVARTEQEVMDVLKEHNIHTIFLQPVFAQANLIDSETPISHDYITSAGLVLMNNIKKVSNARIVISSTLQYGSLVKAGFPKDIIHIQLPETHKEYLKVL